MLIIDIEQKFKVISTAGIYATPTVLINDKIIFNSNSKAEIETAVEKLLTVK